MIDATDLSKHVILTGHRRYPYRALLFNVTSVYALPQPATVVYTTLTTTESHYRQDLQFCDLTR